MQLTWTLDALIIRTTSFSADVCRWYPAFRSKSCKWSVTSLRPHRRSQYGRKSEVLGARGSAPPCNVYSPNRVLNRKALKDRHGMRHAVARVEYDARCPTGRIPASREPRAERSAFAQIAARAGGKRDSGTHRARMACTDMYMAGTLNVSKKICAACSRFELGLSGASVRRTGCCRCVCGQSALPWSSGKAR